MTSHLRLAALIAALTVVVAACGSTGPTVPPSPVPTSPSRRPARPARPRSCRSRSRAPSGSATTGSSSPSPTPAACRSRARIGPSRSATTARPARRSPPAPQAFIWAIEGVNGVYVGPCDVPDGGRVDAPTSRPRRPARQARRRRSASTSASGSRRSRPATQAPSVDTPTLADVGGDVAKVSSDAKPEKRFYETSVADALAAKKPFVLDLRHARSSASRPTCGPTLEKLKPVAAAHPELTFINVEPYNLEFTNGSLQPVMTGERPDPGAGYPRVQARQRADRLRRRC